MPPNASVTAPERPTKTPSESVNAAVSFVGRLDSGELLTGSPTVVEISSSDLTITNAAVSTAEISVSGDAVPAGAAVQFNVAGGTAGTTYRIRVSCGTDASPPQTRVAVCVLRCVAES